MKWSALLSMTKLLCTVQVSVCESISQVPSSEGVEVVAAARQCMKEEVNQVLPTSEDTLSVLFILLMLIKSLGTHHQLG